MSPSLRDVQSALPKFGASLQLRAAVGAASPAAPARYVAERGGRSFPMGTDLDVEVAPQALRAMLYRLSIPKGLFRLALSGGDVGTAWALHQATHQEVDIVRGEC